ncbi:MAG: HD-like signal output (HDOD) protein [Oceanicoccus sp.]|jgi:HD-like signal output (HDOD) protein
MTTDNQYLGSRTIISRVLQNQDHLPSLPAITLKIRQAINNSNTTHESLAMLIGSDPALNALLIKSASSPMYRTASAPKTLEAVISIIGFSGVNNIVMAHSINSLFVNKNPAIKRLYSISRKRQVVKGAISGLLAHKLGYRPADEALMISLLSEVGTLALLSAFKETSDVPDMQTYIKLCREYSKSLGGILLNRWNIDPRLIDIVKHCGHWERESDGKLELLDVINLSLYHAVKHLSPDADLPPLTQLAAYSKLKIPHNEIDQSGQLTLITENQTAIAGMIQMLQ